MTSKTLLCAAGAVACVASAASAQFFHDRHLVITQLGDGAAALTNAANQNTLREYTRDGLATGVSLTLGTATAGARLTNSGSATSEGFITGSAGSGRFLTVAGYDAAAGTAAVSGTANAARDGSGPTRRVVSRIDTWTGAVDYSGYGQTFSANNARSSAFDESTSTVFLSGAGTPGGVRSGALGGGTSTNALTSNLSNTRVVNLFNGQIVASSASGAFLGLSVVAGGTATLIVSTGTGSSVYDFVFADTRTVYMADDRTTALGGLLKYTRTGGDDADVATGAWASAAAFNLTGAATAFAGLRGLAGETIAGVTTLYGISTDNRLVTITDTGISSAFSVLATAPTNTAWRGVELVPTPGSALLLGMGIIASGRRRR